MNYKLISDENISMYGQSYKDAIREESHLYAERCLEFFEKMEIKLLSLKDLASILNESVFSSKLIKVRFKLYEPEKKISGITIKMTTGNYVHTQNIISCNREGGKAEARNQKFLDFDVLFKLIDKSHKLIANELFDVYAQQATNL